MNIDGKTVAFLVSDESDTREYEPILFELEKYGAEAVIVGPDMESLERICLAGDCPISCGLDVEAARNMTFDALVIPDGNGVDAFLHDDQAIDFVKAFDATHKPIAAIGRGLLMLVAGDRVENRHVAAPDELWLDLEAAGAVVVPGGFMKELQESNWITAASLSELDRVAESLVCVLHDMDVTVTAYDVDRQPHD